MQENFAEALPEKCPPSESVDQQLENVVRAVSSATVGEIHFSSFKALGVPTPPGKCDCEWASCSLYESVEQLLKLRGLARRNPFVATLDIPESSGKSTINPKTGHINFWKFSGFSMIGAVKSVTEHGNGA